MEIENIKMNKGKDDKKLEEMMEEMDKEINKQKQIEEQQREERRKKMEADALDRRQSKERVLYEFRGVC